MNKTSKVSKPMLSNRGRPAKYRFGSLKKGRSLLFPLKQRANVAAAAYMFAHRRNWTFRVLNLVKTVRILRVA